MNNELIRFSKYGLVGVVNTVLTYVVFTLLRCVAVQVDVANAAGYVVGMVNSFVMNRRWVFKAQGQGWKRQAVLFVVGAGVCWLVQWCAFTWLLGFVHEQLAYLAGMVVYTVANFVFNRVVTFGKKRCEER